MRVKNIHLISRVITVFYTPRRSLPYMSRHGNYNPNHIVKETGCRTLVYTLSDTGPLSKLSVTNKERSRGREKGDDTLITQDSFVSKKSDLGCDFFFYILSRCSLDFTGRRKFFFSLSLVLYYKNSVILPPPQTMSCLWNRLYSE